MYYIDEKIYYNKYVFHILFFIETVTIQLIKIIPFKHFRNEMNRTGFIFLFIFYLCIYIYTVYTCITSTPANDVYSIAAVESLVHWTHFIMCHCGVFKGSVAFFYFYFRQMEAYIYNIKFLYKKYFGVKI